MTETIRKDNIGPRPERTNIFALALVKKIVKRGPATEKRLKELEESRKDKKLIDKYGEDKINEAFELSKSAEANAIYTQAAFYFYIKRGDEFIMDNLLQYLRSYNKGDAKKFMTELVKEFRITNMPDDDKKYLEEMARMALAKNDDEKVVFVCQAFLSYIDRRNRKKDPKYSEAAALKDHVDILKEW